MTLEQKNGLSVDQATIEFCGTPFAARYKYLVHNAIEDMITERMGDKIRGVQGINDFNWSTTLDKNSRSNYFQNLQRVQELLSLRRNLQRISLIQDGAFAMMILTEIHRKSGILSQKEATDIKKGLLAYTSMEDFIILTLISPRAALKRLMYPQTLEGYEIVRQHKFILFSMFNESAQRTVSEYREELPQIEVIKRAEDDLSYEELFFANADLVFRFLNLPTVDEWDEELKIHQGKRLRNVAEANVAGVSLAGLSRDDIRDHLRRWDWSLDSSKKTQVAIQIDQVVQVLKDHSLLPDK